MRSWQRSVVAALLVVGAESAARGGVGVATDSVALALSGDGRIGAWLVEGPFERGKLPDERQLVPRLGAGWRIAAAREGGAVDVADALDTRATDRIAYAGGVLHVARGGRYVLLLGVDDGVTVRVDGARVFSRDEARPMRDDDDLVPLDLGAGDHTLVLALHQHAGAWTFRARIVDRVLEPPAGASWILPGATDDDGAALAGELARISLDREAADDGWRLRLSVKYPEGVPVAASLAVEARLVSSSESASGEPLFAVSAGEVPSAPSGDEVVVSLPRLEAGEVEDRDWKLEVSVAGRAKEFGFTPRKAVRTAILHATRALAGHPEDSVEHLRDRVAAFVAHGDGDVAAQEADAKELDDLAQALDEGRDPWAGRTGPMRRAYRSPADGKLSEFALYVPPGFSPQRTYPLVVALHGMNGRPMQMLMWFFGHDDPQRDGYWEDRHPLHDLEPLDAIVVSPGAHFNAMYREMGEDDVMRVLDWALGHFPIDRSRVTITGPSMGGIGTAACALHHPDRFAAAAPLCGYHSYFIRSDMNKDFLHPWEKYGAEVRSNVEWAENGLYLPMYVVHGTKDLPEENSGVLIDRYNDLHYSMKDEHPELGHNVWQTTYEDLKGAKWLLDHARPMHPRALRFKTPRTRWGDDAWLHVRELASSDAWGEVQARIDKDNSIHVSTTRIDAIAFDRDAERIDDALPVTVSIDRSKLVFQAGEPIELHREIGGPNGSTWAAGEAPHAGPYKHGAVTGPIRDAFHEPLLFVWGASDPAQSRANEDAARAWAHVRPGVEIDYPAMSDEEFFARGEKVANDRALFLVGNARSNRVVRELEPSFPIRIDGGEVVVGDKRFGPRQGEDPSASQLGVAFVRPNPERSDRYVVVVEGVGPLGTWRSTSLPDLLPDYVVYDEGVAEARGQLVLGAARVRLAGFFGKDWDLTLPEGGGDGSGGARAENSPSP